MTIKNPVNPNKGEPNDSDDYFFRGLLQPNVRVYFDFLPTGLTAEYIKLKIKNSSNSVLRERYLSSTSSGENLLVEWNGKNSVGSYYNEWDFRASIEVKVDGQTYESDDHQITDLLYKHRPIIRRVHPSDYRGPVDVAIMMEHSKLWHKEGFKRRKVKNEPIWFRDLERYDFPTDSGDYYFMDMDNTYRQAGLGAPTVYCEGKKESGHAFLQYWHFEPYSSLPEHDGVYHEGDWEMFQIAVKLDTANKELKPIAVTASQHYYGQTIRWASNGNGPSSQNQDWVGKIGHQPIVFIARHSHATYFRQGSFRCPTFGGGANHGLQYAAAPTWNHLDDVTGGISYSYTLRIFQPLILPYWHGRWGNEVLGSTTKDGPASPAYRKVHSTPHINIWNNPKEFHNYYLKLKNYSKPKEKNNLAHPEIEIE